MEKTLVFGSRKVAQVSLDHWESITGMKVTRNCSGKMKGMWAFNTSMTANPLCQALAKNEDLVCYKCYAKGFMGMYKSSRERFTKNFQLIIEKPLQCVPDLRGAMPYGSKAIFRFEEFGDIGNKTHALNYLLIALSNPEVTFGWWSKHMDIVNAVLQEEGLSIPDNLSMVASSYKMNKIDTRYQKYDFIDHVFTVYRKDFCDANGVETNCAASSCYNCLRCYVKNKNDYYINEMLKKDARKKK